MRIFCLGFSLDTLTRFAGGGADWNPSKGRFFPAEGSAGEEEREEIGEEDRFLGRSWREAYVRLTFKDDMIVSD